MTYARTVDAGELIREARWRHGIDQRTLALRSRTDARHIGRIERGEVSPSVATLAKLLEVMGERLDLRAVAGPHGNQPTEQIRADYERLTPADSHDAMELVAKRVGRSVRSKQVV
jgi:transcriptional regulator with XRE-family HTH domain